MIIIEIQNPEDLANERTGRFKRLLAKIFHINIQKKVDEIVAKNLSSALAAEGIEANIRIR